MDTKETNKAFMELKEVNEELSKEPRIEDYYTPSPEMKKYQVGAVSIIGAGAGLLIGWLL